MTKEDRDIQRKLKVLRHAEKTGHVARTCRYFGVGRSSIYRWRAAYEQRGEEEDYGGEIDFDQMRGNIQAPFLIATGEGGFTANLPDGGTREVPLSLRVVGHEGRHRMTLLAKAGVTSVPVVVMVQDRKIPLGVSEIRAGPQRSRSDQVSTGDTPAALEGMVPISYATRDELAAEFGRGRELFQTGASRGPSQANTQVEPPQSPLLAYIQGWARRR